MTDIFKKTLTETESEYVIRVCSLRNEYGYSWVQLTDIINSELRLSLSPDAYRKRWSAYKSNNDLFEQQEIEDSLLDLQKLKIQISDERCQNRAYIRKLAREDVIAELIRSSIQNLNSLKPLPKNVHINDDIELDAILEISDWHYGIEINNFWNIFNTDVAGKRIAELSNKVIAILKQHHLTHLNVLNLGDMIAGRIHNCIRLQSRIDVITQIIEVSELIAQFLTSISAYVNIDYYDCLDNHSRLEPKKEESLDAESLARITTWFLKERLKDTNISIHSNPISDDIISFESLGHKICGVHGHKDSTAKLIDNLCLLNKEHYDLICSAHVHHFISEEKNEVIVITNGSLMGTDDYAQSIRENSKPSQNLIIISESNPCECVYRIQLDS